MGRRTYRHLTARPVIVTTLTGRSIRGLLTDERNGIITLREAVIYVDGSRADADGELIVPVENIDYVQALDSGSAS